MALVSDKCEILFYLLVRDEGVLRALRDNRRPIVFFASLLGGISAWAGSSSANVPQYGQAFGEGFATPDEVEDALGQLTYTITACQNEAIGMPSRSVRVTAEKPDYENRRIVETVLYQAVRYAWQSCPLHVIFGMTQESPQLRYEVKSVELHLPDGSLAVRATWFASALGPYRWGSVDDVGATSREAEARQLAQEEQARRNAEAQAQYQAQRAESSAAFWHGAKQIAIGIGILFALRWLYRRRVRILRWYYFNFHPHPAEPMVRSALRGAPVDGKALGAALGELPSRDSILRGVRIEQGERIVEKMRRVSERTIKQDRVRARADYEHAAFYGVQEAIALAAVALERARAAHTASKSI